MHQFSPYRDIPYCERSMQETMERQVGSGLLIVAFDGSGVVGGIGGGLSPLFINKAYLMAFEQYWWVHEEHRGRLGLRLLKAFETRCQELGCAYLMMMTLSLNDVGALYERLGYVRSETGYVKRL